MRLTEPPGAFFRLARQYGFAQRRLYRPTKSPPPRGRGRVPVGGRDEEEKWMNVYLKGCCCLSTKISVKQLPYAPRIPDFGRFVVNSL